MNNSLMINISIFWKWQKALRQMKIKSLIDHLGIFFQSQKKNQYLFKHKKKYMKNKKTTKFCVSFIYNKTCIKEGLQCK